MHLTRGGRLVALASGVVAALLAPQSPQAFAEIGGSDFPAALLTVLQLLCLGLSAWLLLIVLAAMVRVRVPGVPRSVQLLLFATATSVVTVTAAAVPAHAESRHDLTGLPLPDRPSIERTVSTTHEPVHRVRVRPGDTLWSIAAQQLPDSATDADVASACAAWHRANRAQIGPDPDLIVAGQTFTAPTEEPS